MTVFDYQQNDRPANTLAYGGQPISKLRRQIGNSLYRLERGRPYYKQATRSPVVALPQFSSLPISSPTANNAGSFIYTTSTQQIQRPSHVGKNQVLPP